MTRPRLAFFDDYPNSDLGHHPELILGLTCAAAKLSPDLQTRFYCPTAYIPPGELPPQGLHIACEGRRPYTPDTSRGTALGACVDAAQHGATALVNLFLDENHRSFPARQANLSLVHVLHRPGIQPRGPGSPRPDLQWLFAAGRDDLVVVHTRRGVDFAQQLVPRRNLVRIGWPTATRDEIAARFTETQLARDDEPYVLFIGDARDDKGIHWLLSALADGPRLVIVGQQTPGRGTELISTYPRTRIDVHYGWRQKTGIDEMIAGAAVIVFPYERAFGLHGGASAALAQALTHPRPIVLSSVLADQIPASDACIVVPVGDGRNLRGALDRAISERDALDTVASERLSYVLQEHTYEGHIEGILERLESRG